MPASASSLDFVATVSHKEPSAGEYQWKYCIITPFMPFIYPPLLHRVRLQIFQEREHAAPVDASLYEVKYHSSHHDHCKKTDHFMTANVPAGFVLSCYVHQFASGVLPCSMQHVIAFSSAPYLKRDPAPE